MLLLSGLESVPPVFPRRFRPHGVLTIQRAVPFLVLSRLAKLNPMRVEFTAAVTFCVHYVHV
jgi:hypothetical protein